MLLLSRLEQKAERSCLEPGKTVRAVLDPGLEEDLGVRLGPEDSSPGFQVPAKLHVVVNFPIEDNVPTPIGRGHRLGPAGKIENTEPAVAQADGGVTVGSLGIRAAMGQGAGHPRQDLLWGVRLVAKRGKTGDPAHGG